MKSFTVVSPGHLPLSLRTRWPRFRTVRALTDFVLLPFRKLCNLMLLVWLFLLAGCHGSTGESDLRLVHLDRFNIESEAMGLEEPSGLALSLDRTALWTVSDDTKRLFKLGLDGQLHKHESFSIAHKDLEGLSLDITGKFLLAVKEDENSLLKISIATQALASSKRLAEMRGYGPVAEYFALSDANKGLEGITLNPSTGSVFVMKEGRPGLLIEVSSDLETILGHRLLNEANGFRADLPKGDEIDFSGIAYDPSQDRFWIISDKARRLFLYDWERNEVIQSTALTYYRDGKHREIQKAEGVAIDPDAQRLYVVSDKEAHVYIFALEGVKSSNI